MKMREFKPRQGHSELVNATREQVRRYSNDGINVRGLFVADEERHYYAAIGIVEPDVEIHLRRRVDVIMLARVEGEYIIIEEDRMERPLVDALIQNAGVPEAQIICAYVGEEVTSA